MGRPLQPNYEFLNFNDFPNSCVFLWTIFVNNNWVNLSYLAMLKLDNRYSMFFFICFYLVTYFFVLNIIVGFIIEVILTYLNKKYSANVRISDAAIEKIRDQNEYSESTETDEEDENVFVDDEIEKDIESMIRDLLSNLNKGLTSNVKAFGAAEEEQKNKEFEMQKKDEMPLF